MAKTDVERQREHRRRRSERLAELEARAAENDRETAELRAELDTARAEVERLGAMVCRHPSGAVDGGHCHACGADVW